MVRVLPLVLLVFLVLILIIPPYIFLPANTFLAQQDVSLWTRESVKEKIDKSTSQPLKLVVNGERRELTYGALGIGINKDDLWAEISEVSVIEWWVGLDQMKWIRPAMAYEPDFEARLADLTVGTDYKIDSEDFRQRLAINFGSGVTMEPSLLASNWATPTPSESPPSEGGEARGVEGVVAGASTGPNSLGNENGKYIEVDISDQKLYQIEDKKLVGSHDVSTGLNYPTPTGRFRILNKAKSAYSGIFDVIMPYWMGFNYQTDIGAYVGIHELPYRLKGGEKIYRFGNYIGTKKTGGCVALNPGEAAEVYAWASEGMPVLIFD